MSNMSDFKKGLFIGLGVMAALIVVALVTGLFKR